MEDGGERGEYSKVSKKMESERRWKWLPWRWWCCEQWRYWLWIWAIPSGW